MARPNDSGASGYQLREDKDTIALLVTERCVALRIRALIGGGPVFLRNRLITPAVSPLVSLIVDPASAPHLIRALRGAGWHEKRAPRFRVLPTMSTIFTHDDCIAALRIFTVIPGFFADPEEVFDRLWERSQPVNIRGQNVPGLDRIATAIFATHDRLDGRRQRNGTQFHFFANQFKALLSQTEREDLGALVQAMGASEEMRPLLDELDIQPGPLVLPSEGYARMRLAVDSVTLQTRWALALLELPGHRRWALARSYLAQKDASRARFERLAQLPHTLAALAGSRRRWTAANRSPS
ncbi:MAG: hypothetical protein JWR53_1050 [Glaciihabitans sp.]|nr:hypothetical protein [Glaciihabitans sp.]